MPRASQLLSRRDYSKELDGLRVLFDTKERGDLASHSEIETATGLKQSVSPWSIVLGKYRKELLVKRGISIRCERNVGYKLLTIEEQLQNDDHRRRARRELQKDTAEKVLIKDEELTDQQRLLQAALANQTFQTTKALQVQAIERKSFLASPDTVTRYCRTNDLKARTKLENDLE